jgi:pheromone shutdown protein TraB
MTVLSTIAKLVHDTAFSILIANAAVLALTSIRNAHVSDRARANVDEAFHKLHKSALSVEQSNKRVAELREQNVHFLDRYRITSNAFIFLTLALILFVGEAALSAEKNGPILGDIGMAAAGLLAAAAIVCLILGLVGLLREFWRGSTTLISNNSALDNFKIIEHE